MKRKKITTRILLCLLAILLMGIFLQQLKIIKLKPLDGYFIIAEPQKFSWKNWFSGEYQEKTEHYLNDNYGFRAFFIRLNHQICFSLFNKAKIAWLVVGKENYLYETNYVNAVFGIDFIGEDSIRNRMQKLKAVANYLAPLNKNIIWVLAAGKGSFYSEYIPDNYSETKGVTNEEIYLKYADSLNINHINFNAFFKAQKQVSPYPLYPQYGIHWSYYAACLALDSIVRYVENLRHIEMSHHHWDKVDMRQPIAPDKDLAAALNMFFDPKTFDLGYPQLRFEPDSTKSKPSLLVVSDSFFWIMYNHFNVGWLFDNVHFWYYNNQVYPENLPRTNFNLKDEIEKYDVILILGTNATLPGFGWGFIEQAYDELEFEN